jgi:hypothetical protein
MSLFEDASLIVTPNAVKAGKLYSIKPTDGSGDLSVVRATTKTRVNSLGVIESVPINVAALDYSNGSCPSILVEPQRTNLFTYSEQFDNAIWIKTGSTISANAINSPNGTLTADRMVDNISTGGHFVERLVSSSGVNTLSVFCKKDNNRYVELCAASALLNSARFIFDFDTKTITSFGAIGTTITYVGSNITELQDGWFRLSLTFSVISSTLIYCSFILSNSPNVGTTNSVSYAGDGTKGVYIWGAQYEAGANATSYIPTVASAVTRNADVISKTGISDLIGQTEGTLFAEFSTKNILSTNKRILGLKSSNNQNRIALRIINNGNLGVEVFSNNLSIYNNNANVSLISNTFFKILVTYTNTKIKMFVNGLLVLESGVVNFSPNEIISTLTLGISEVNFVTEIIDGSIKEAVVFKTALSDQECINLTTL